ncbi:jg4751 [Pararge aegeria aegeria]|uniref:Jg4751 protein n=1 Tax=Pararge aegeria aegeria TaxID=348720 RepID=A0A8S4QZ88_9NEOP|nr:jg4751 [Pararge aegeria aegeria]
MFSRAASVKSHETDRDVCLCSYSAMRTDKDVTSGVLARFALIFESVVMQCVNRPLGAHQERSVASAIIAFVAAVEACPEPAALSRLTGLAALEALPSSRTAKQPNSHTAKQPNSQTAKQPNRRVARVGE